jgi:hypothetical protein
MKPLNNKRFKAITNEITETCDCNGGYCFWRQLVESQHPSLRLLIQLECIEKFKYIRSEQENKDIGSSAAAMEWVEQGYAKVFADVFNEDLSIKEIFKKTMELVDKAKRA